MIDLLCCFQKCRIRKFVVKKQRGYVCFIMFKLIRFAEKYRYRTTDSFRKIHVKCQQLIMYGVINNPDKEPYRLWYIF